MRIALVHPYPWPEVRRGAERYVDDLSWYLASRGHAVTVVTGTHGGPGTARSDWGATVVRRRLLRGSTRLGLGEVETFGLAALPPLVTARFDVVHAMVPSAALAGRLTGHPTLYSVLGHPSRDQLPDRRLARLVFSRAVRHATAVAALSRASADALASLAGRRPHVLPPGVRLERFSPHLAPRTGPPTVLLSASLEDPRKRARLAVDAFTLLLATRPDARLVLSGPGDPGPVLQGTDPRTLRAVDAPGPGDPDEVPERYRRATVTVLPAAHEAFGLVLVESLACGTPVVCTADGGMAEVVTADVGAVAARPTPSALCQALETALSLAADPATPGKCVERARRWAWDGAVGPAHLELYERLRERRDARAAPS